MEKFDPELYNQLVAIGKMVVAHMYENKIINNLDSDFVLSVLDTTSNECVAQVLHTDFNLTDVEIVQNENVKLVLIPLANEMKLRVVKGSQCYGFEQSMENGYQNHHFKYATVVPIELGQYICIDPRLWHSGWTTKFNVNYRIHLYVGFNKHSLEQVSKKYATITGSSKGDNLFFKLSENVLQCLNGTIQREVYTNAILINKERKRQKQSNGKFMKK